MPLQTITYHQYLKEVPETGKHILAQQTNDDIVVYQAYNKAIADFAIKNQFFGGNVFSYYRMSWIKPSFLWMMYRCGWASKINQERVLAIWIKKADFNHILKEAVHSSFQESIYESRAPWQQLVKSKEVRLQWDPDHDIHGRKQARKAIQLGLKGNILRRYGKQMIQQIEDITPFVLAQKKLIDSKEIEALHVPFEEIYQPEIEKLKEKLELNY